MARIVYHMPDGRQHAFELGSLTRVGRHPACQIQILDKIVSKAHFEIEMRNDGYWIRDLGTLNGTYVNGVRVRAEMRLSHLDEIAIGQNQLLFSDPDNAMRRSPSAGPYRSPAPAPSERPEVIPPAPTKQPEPDRGDLTSLRRFYALARMLSAESNPKQLAADATQGLLSLCPAEWAVLCVRDTQGGFTELERIGREKPPDDLGPFPPLFDVAAQAQAATFQLGPGGALQLVVPLVHAGNTSGVFWVGFATGSIDVPPIIEMLSTYGSFVATALKALAGGSP